MKTNFSLYSWATSYSTDIFSLYSGFGIPLVIDVEHTSISENQLFDALVCFSSSMDIYVRTPYWSNYNYMNRILDLGAKGFLLPNVRSAESILDLNDNINYPTRGAAISSMNNYSLDVTNYQSLFSPILIPMCENKDFIANIDSILKIPFIDKIIIGPYDLSQSLNVPQQYIFDSGILDSIIEKCHHYSVSILKHSVDPDFSAISKDIEKFDGVALSTEVQIIKQFFQQFINKIQS